MDGPGKIPLNLALAVTLAGNCPADIAVLRAERVRSLADGHAPGCLWGDDQDLDGVPLVEHSDKQDADPSWAKTYGHPPLTGFVDHGPGRTGEPVAAPLRLTRHPACSSAHNGPSMSRSLCTH